MHDTCAKKGCVWPKWSKKKWKKRNKQKRRKKSQSLAVKKSFNRRGWWRVAWSFQMTFTCCGVVVVTRVQWWWVEWWGGGVDANRWFLGGVSPFLRYNMHMCTGTTMLCCVPTYMEPSRNKKFEQTPFIILTGPLWCFPLGFGSRKTLHVMEQMLGLTMAEEEIV